jgi:hypothetical protein
MAFIAPYPWRGSPVIFPKPSDRAHAPLCGRQAGILWKGDIPPMLAAQFSFPSGALGSLHQEICPTNLEMTYIYIVIICPFVGQPYS